MKIVKLIDRLRHHGVQLQLQGSQLKCKLPKGGIPQDLKQDLSNQIPNKDVKFEIK